MRGRLPLWLVLVPLLYGCASVQPYQDADTVGFADDQEKRLWNISEKFDRGLAYSDHLFSDERLRVYLQGIIDRLYPEFRGTLRVNILKSPALNAFVLPNGSIYINTSLIARFANEAQAATVIGHEAAHFVARHSLQQSQRTKFTTALANGISLTGIPFVGPVLAVSSIAGYSQALEAEADELAFERLLKAGYATAEAIKVFQRMAAETQALEIKEPFFFSTHPKMQARVESFREMHAKRGRAGDTGRPDHLELTRVLRIHSLEEDLSMYRYKSVILALQAEGAARIYPEYTRYHLGEAYRMRGAAGDEQRALDAYRRAVSRAPEYAPSYRALGYHFFKARQDAQALENLEKYLELAPQAADREYVLFYLEQIRGRR